MVQVRQGGQVEQDKGKLEGTPAAIALGPCPPAGRLATAFLFGVQRMDALQPHGAVHEVESLPGLAAGCQTVNSCLHALKCLAAVLKGVSGDILVAFQSGRWIADAPLLCFDPGGIGCD